MTNTTHKQTVAQLTATADEMRITLSKLPPRSRRKNKLMWEIRKLDEIIHALNYTAYLSRLFQR